MKLVIRDLAAREILAAARYYRDAAGPRFQKGLVDEIGRASASSAYSRLRAESRSVTRKSRAQCPSREVPLPRLLLRRRRRPIRHRAPPRPAAARSVPRTLSGSSRRVARDAACVVSESALRMRAYYPLHNRCRTLCHLSSPTVRSRRRDRIHDAREIPHSRVRSRLFSRSAANPASPCGNRTIVNARIGPS